MKGLRQEVPVTLKKADEIRDKLLSMGILIKDLEDKTVWDYNPDN